MLTTRYFISLCSAVITVLGASAVFGQEYPSKPIRIFTGNAGGSNDAAARLIGGGISGPLGQPVIIENRTSSLLSAQAVAATPPDGYNLVISGDLLWLNPLLLGLPDQTVNFAPISMLASAPIILCVHPSLPVKSVKELIALARARPGELNAAAATPGGMDHLATEVFKGATATRFVIVHYKGGAGASTALAGGEMQLMFGIIAPAMPYVRSGRIRALAVTSAQPTVMAPGVPTLADSGLPGFDLASIDALYAPAKTPTAIVNRVNQEIVRFLKTKEAQDRYLALGAEVVASSPEAHAAILKSRIAVIGKVIKDANIKIQ